MSEEEGNVRKKIVVCYDAGTSLSKVLYQVEAERVSRFFPFALSLKSFCNRTKKRA